MYFDMNTTTFDTLSAARSLEAAGIEAKQAEAIVQAIRSSGESAVTKTDLAATAAELRGEINAAVNKMYQWTIIAVGIGLAGLALKGQHQTGKRLDAVFSEITNVRDRVSRLEGLLRRDPAALEPIKPSA